MSSAQRSAPPQPPPSISAERLHASRHKRKKEKKSPPLDHEHRTTKRHRSDATADAIVMQRPTTVKRELHEARPPPSAALNADAGAVNSETQPPLPLDHDQKRNATAAVDISSAKMPEAIGNRCRTR